MSSFIFKIIAIITMLIDHLGYVVFNGNFSYFNYIGRLAFPIFAFQISEGYIHTKNFKKYFFKLFIFAIISQLPFMLFHSIMSPEISLNIFFTLLLGLTGIYFYDKLKTKFNSFGVFLGILTTIFIGLLSNYIKSDYGLYGVLIIVSFYIFKNNKLNNFLMFLILTLGYYLYYMLKIGYTYKYILLISFTILPILLITIFYNNKKGKDTKYFLYLFYPIHLLILYTIYYFF